MVKRAFARRATGAPNGAGDIVHIGRDLRTMVADAKLAGVLQRSGEGFGIPLAAHDLSRRRNERAQARGVAREDGNLGNQAALRQHPILAQQTGIDIDEQTRLPSPPILIEHIRNTVKRFLRSAPPHASGGP
jgi:hypothetical protein